MLIPTHEPTTDASWKDLLQECNAARSPLSKNVFISCFGPLLYVLEEGSVYIDHQDIVTWMIQRDVESTAFPNGLVPDSAVMLGWK